MGALHDKTKLESDLHRTQDELGDLRNRKPEQAGLDTSDLEGQMAQVKEQMEQV